MKVMLVGGTFDDDGGKPSKIVCFIRDALIANDKVSMCEFVNGGWFTDLGMIIADLERFDVILWFANVPNDKPKLRNIKELYPKKYLVTSKRNFGEYSFQYLINHALKLKSNLAVEFCMNEHDQIIGRVFDPLGAVWCDFTPDFTMLTHKLIERMEFLMRVTRKSTFQTDGSVAVPNEVEFVQIIKDRAEVFHKLVNPS